MAGILNTLLSYIYPVENVKLKKFLFPAKAHYNEIGRCNMICGQCHTLNPDNCAICLECQAVMATSGSHKFVHHFAKTRPDNSIVFHEPQFFTFKYKVLGNLFGLLPLVLFFGIIALHAWAFFYQPVDKDLLLTSFIITVIGYKIVLCWLIPVFQSDPSNMKHFSNYGDGFVVQVSFNPRRYDGIEGILEDADDLGIVTFNTDGVVFHGDSAYFVISKSDIDSIKIKNVGAGRVRS